MKHISQRLTWALMMTGVLVSLAVVTTPVPVHADTCAPIATLPADLVLRYPLDTGANVIASFNDARQQEGCNVSLSIDPAAYDAATPQQQTLMLVNAERQDRGLPTLQLDTTLMSQILMNHLSEMKQYIYCSHASPINQPNDKNVFEARLKVNPAISGHYDGYGENLYCGHSPDNAARGIYWFMYQDSSDNWHHRQGILGYGGGTTFGFFTWIGIAVATVTDSSGNNQFFSMLVFLDDAYVTEYTPPATADMQPPTMDSPTIVDANTVQVINVTDDSDGSTSGVAGVTGVVFYIGSAVQNGNFQTVVATQVPPGTWTATLSATDPRTLHAVAVNGSGNYTDTAGNQ